MHRFLEEDVFVVVKPNPPNGVWSGGAMLNSLLLVIVLLWLSVAVGL